MIAARTHICIFNFTINYNPNLVSAPTASYYVCKTAISKATRYSMLLYNWYFPFHPLGLAATSGITDLSSSFLKPHFPACPSIAGCSFPIYFIDFYLIKFKSTLNSVRGPLFFLLLIQLHSISFESNQLRPQLQIPSSKTTLMFLFPI